MSTIKVTKNGIDKYEIEDTEEELATAKAKGYRPLMTVTKNGEDHFDIDASDTNEVRLAFDKGYFDVNAYKNLENSGGQKPIRQSESAVRGFFQGASLGGVDELSGRLEQFGSLAGVRGLGGEGLFNTRLETDEERLEPSSEVYLKQRNKRRYQDKAAEEANPMTYAGTQMLGGMAAPIGAGLGAKTVAGAIGIGAATGGLEGGISGYLGSDSDNGWDQAGEAVTGAVLGTGIGGLAGGATNMISRALSKEGRAGLRNEANAFGRGFKNAASEERLANVIPGGKIFTGTKGGFDEINATVTQDADFAKLIKREKQTIIQRIVQEGHSPEDIQKVSNVIERMPDQEFADRMLLEDGPNRVKAWVQKNATTAFGGRFTGEEYDRVLNMPVEERNAARRFNAREAADEFMPAAEKAGDEFGRANRQRFSESEVKASKAFADQDAAVDELIDDIGVAMQDAKSQNTDLKNVLPRLEDAFNILQSGKGPSFLNLKQGDYVDAISPEDRFFRLQKMREKLDAGIDWDAIEANRRKMNDGEKILMGVRDKVDKILKFGDHKVDADKVWQKMNAIEKSVFSKGELGGEVDKYKFAQLLNDTQTANRFRDNLEDLKAWANDESFDPASRDAVKDFLQKFDAAYEKAFKKKLIGDFQYKGGPSSSAIERLGSQLQKNSNLEEAIKNPATFIQSADAFVENYVKPITGKTFNELNQSEKQASVQLWAYIKKRAQDGRPITDEHAAEMYKKLLGNGPDGGGSGRWSPFGSALQSSGKMQGVIRNALKNYIESKSTGFVADQLARVAGSENGINVFEPMKEDFGNYLKKEYGLGDTEIKIIKAMLPSNPIEFGGMLKSIPISHWTRNPVRHGQTPLRKSNVPENMVAERAVRISGGNYKHRVYINGNNVSHYLFKGDEPVAKVSGKMAHYDHYGNGDFDSSGLAVNWSQSDIPKKKLGQRLYELALDSHGTLMSDTSLSPDGSLRMYQDNFPKIPGVHVSDAAEGGDERFVVTTDRGNANTRNRSKTRAWTDEQRKAINSVPDERFEKYSGDSENDYSRYDDDDEPHYSEEELQEKRDEKKRDEFRGEVRNIRNNRLRYRLKGERYGDELRDMAILAEHPKAEILADEKAKALKEQDPAVFAERGSGTVRGLVDRLWLLQNSPRHKDSRVVVSAVERNRSALQDLLNHQKNQIGELRLSKQFGLLDNDKEINELWKEARRNPLYDDKTEKAFESHVADPYVWADNSYNNDRVERMAALKNSPDTSHQKAFQRMFEEYSDRRDVRNRFDPEYRAKEAQRNLERNWRDYQTMLWKVQSGSLDRDGGTYTPERARQIISEYEAEIPQEMKKTGARLPENWRELSFEGMIGGPMIPDNVSYDQARRIASALNSTGKMRDQAIKAVAAFPNRDRLLRWIAQDGIELKDEVIKAILGDDHIPF